MGPEMAAIEEHLDGLFKQRNAVFADIAKMEPANLHEAASLMVIAARIEVYDPGPAAPLVRRALAFIATGTCPHCGEPMCHAACRQAEQAGRPSMDADNDYIDGWSIWSDIRILALMLPHLLLAENAY
jgi:hypothetical protein